MKLHRSRHTSWGWSFRLLVGIIGLSIVFVFSQTYNNKTFSLGPTESIGISPALIFSKVNAGSSKAASIQINNSGSDVRTVNLSVKQFGVNAYSYTYNFQNPKESWISLSQKTVTVQPHQTTQVGYTISVPSGSAPGGNYFTIIASSTYNTGDIKSIGQAASLVYVTVNGKLSYSSHMLVSSVSHFSFGSNINYKFTIAATGNVYQYVNVFGQLHGLTAGSPSVPQTHIIYPNAPRTVVGSISHPILPGIYSVSYGYTTSSRQAVNRSSWVIYIPPWFVALVIVVIILILSYRAKGKNQSLNKKTNHSKEQQ